MSEVDVLKEEIRSLKAELQSLKQAKEGKAEALFENLEQKLNLSKDDALKMAQTLSEEVKKSPLKSLAIAAGIGFIAARVLR